MTKLRPPVKIHGGKYYLAAWVLENFPENYHTMDYVEPFVGAGSVFLNKKPSEFEVINDIDQNLIQIWRALRDEPTAFISRLKRTNYAESSFNRVKNRDGDYKDYMEHAVTEFILRRMSRGGLKQAFAWSERKRGGIPGDVNAWNTIIEELPEIAQRCAKVNIFNKSAVDIIKAFDDDNSLIYCDPPYLHDTRTSKDSYEHELSTEDHVKLADTLNSCRGKVIISGYPSTLYSRLYHADLGWKCVKKSIANHASQSKTKTRKTECLWKNFDI